MSIKGFTFNNGELEKYDYNSLDNRPFYSEYKPMTSILETKEYEFVEESGIRALSLDLTSLPPIIAGTPYNFTFGNETVQITFVLNDGDLEAGNRYIDYSGYEDTGENYYIRIRTSAEGGYTVIIYTTEPAGTYTVGLSYISDNVPLILNGTYTFDEGGE